MRGMHCCHDAAGSQVALFVRVALPQSSGTSCCAEGKWIRVDCDHALRLLRGLHARHHGHVGFAQPAGAKLDARWVWEGFGFACVWRNA